MDKIVVVTGAGRGLGYCITKKHLLLGDVVYGLEFQITGELKELQHENPRLHIAQCDLGDDASVKNAVRELLAPEKRVDIVYSVAGIFAYHDDKGLAATDSETCIKYYNVNTLGTLRLGREIWPLIGKGTLVVIVSSEAGSIGATRRRAEYAYCMSKAAVNMLGKLLSNELWEKEARVLLFHPGWLRTQMGGDRAKRSSASIEPGESADNIVNIAVDIDKWPRDQLYMTHQGELLSW
ncbi:MAG: SDR family NAD(P)-dependent oxidoreductase [Treponema sp.]|jgi:NAD(P)-dependent dehydrogenase (short-subunit alcohol dehydrogenase family)|nr:SDR family NAD(P)-dependent oxidoreductase [Treponema sp.]